MEQSLDKKDLKAKLISIFIKNKIKIFSTISLIFFIFLIFFFNKEYGKKENILLSEKYVRADILLSEKQNEKAKNLFEEIILAGNSFYSILALNTLLEKNLVADKDKILEYFIIIENLNLQKDNTDLIKFKKALFLIKSKDTLRGKKILKNLIKENSKLKSISEELLKN